jgi:hypothetical protein
LSALLSKTLKRQKARVRKSVRQDAKEIFEETRAGRKSGEASAKPVGKLGPIGKGSGAPRVSPGRTEDVVARFESDVAMHADVARGRSKLVSPDLTERERSIERFKRQAADSPKSVNALLSFGLEFQQARTLEQMLGQFFGQPIKLVGSRELRKAQDTANKLISSMKGHWDAALPDGQTRAAALKSVFDKLKAELKRNPSVNPSRFVRKELFDPWRKRFMKRLGADAALRAELRAATGIEILTDSDIPRFSLKLKMGKSEIAFGFDVDHAETRLSDAVRNAKRPEDLLSVIESDGMQLLTPRENRLQIEALRKATREYFDNADEAAVAYFRRQGTSAAELNSDIDRMIDVLDGPAEAF